MPKITISQIGISVFNAAKAVAANGNKIANAIAKSSKPFLIVFLQILLQNT